MDRLYQNGLKFSQLLKDNLKNYISLVEDQRKGCILLVDGMLGEGKTTLAIEIGDEINKEKGLPPIILEPGKAFQYAMGGEDFKRKFDYCATNGLPCLVYDEAGDFSKRGSLTKFNSQLNRIFETSRSAKVIIIIVLPFFNILDSHLFRIGVVRVLINCYNKNQKAGYGDFRGFGLYKINLLKKYIDLAKNPSNKKVDIACYRYTSPNFRGHFLNLDESRAEALAKVCDDFKAKERKKQIGEKELSPPDPEKYINLEEMRILCNRTKAYTLGIVKDLNIRAKVSFNKKRYYLRDEFPLVLRESDRRREEARMR